MPEETENKNESRKPPTTLGGRLINGGVSRYVPLWLFQTVFALACTMAGAFGTAVAVVPRSISNQSNVASISSALEKQMQLSTERINDVRSEHAKDMAAMLAQLKQHTDESSKRFSDLVGGIEATHKQVMDTTTKFMELQKETLTILREQNAVFREQNRQNDELIKRLTGKNGS